MRLISVVLPIGNYQDITLKAMICICFEGRLIIASPSATTVSDNRLRRSMVSG